MNILLILLIAMIVIAAGGGMWGHSRWGWRGYSPVGVLVAILLIAVIFGAFSRT